jgi:hypothetical protein
MQIITDPTTFGSSQSPFHHHAALRVKQPQGVAVLR